MRTWQRVLIMGAGLLAGCYGPSGLADRNPTHPKDDPSHTVASDRVPSLEALPQDEGSELVRFGYRLVADTQGFARPYVGNALNCTNCHLDAGRKPHAGPFVGLAGVFPEYRARNARLNSLEDRLDDCFERSLNGRRLPRDSREMRALTAYIAWLSEGVPKGADLPWRGFPRIPASRAPDQLNGEKLFAARCAGCHGAEGQGTPAGPPVWGPRSYNIGAGMARVGVAAAFIKANMPLGQGGTLTDEEAYDLAAFIDRQPRPDFSGKVHDWPKGDKPADAPY